MKQQAFFYSSGVREEENGNDEHTHIVLYFNNTPRDLFAALKKRNSHWTNPPPAFDWGYYRHTPQGEPPLFVSFELARPVTVGEYKRLVPLFVAIFEPYLEPVWRWRVSATESGTYESPSGPQKVDPDFYLTSIAS